MSELNDDSIDIHTHVVPESFPPYAGNSANVPWPSMVPAHACHQHVMISGKVYRTVGESCWSVERRTSDMDQVGIRRQVLSPMPELLSYWLPAEDATVLLRYINDEIAGMIAKAPARLIGLGAVPLQDADLAIRELEYIMRELGFAGVEIATHVNGVSIGAPQFEPFFAAAQRIGAAIFVHALRPAGRERLVGPASLEQVVAFPGDTALAIASLITGGILERLPDLRIAVSHGGGAFAMVLPRLEHGWKTIPAVTETIARSPRTYARRLYYDSLVYDVETLGHLIKLYGVDRICLGSDYPFQIRDPDPCASVGKLGADAETVAMLRAGNARRFLNLDTVH